MAPRPVRAMACLLGGCALLACSSERDDPPAPSTASTPPAPIASGALASASANAPSRLRARDVTQPERHATCAKVTRQARPECADNQAVDDLLTAKCEGHPIWKCADVFASDIEDCWIPSRTVRTAPPACDGFPSRLAACNVDTAIRSQCPGYLERVAPGGAAARAGLLSGDRILAIDGAPFSALGSLSKIVNASEGQPLRMKVSREGKGQLEISVTAEKQPDGIYRIGVIPGYPPDCPFLPTADVLACKTH